MTLRHDLQLIYIGWNLIHFCSSKIKYYIVPKDLQIGLIAIMSYDSCIIASHIIGVHTMNEEYHQDSKSNVRHYCNRVHCS